MKAPGMLVINASLYQSDIFNDTDEAIVEEIPVEAVSNSYLERAFNQTEPCSGRWMRNASSKPNNKKGNQTNAVK